MVHIYGVSPAASINEEQTILWKNTTEQLQNNAATWQTPASAKLSFYLISTNTTHKNAYLMKNAII